MALGGARFYEVILSQTRVLARSHLNSNASTVAKVFVHGEP